MTVTRSRTSRANSSAPRRSLNGRKTFLRSNALSRSVAARSPRGRISTDTWVSG